MMSEEKTVEGFPCPSCGVPQTEFLYNPRKRGWVYCQSCKKYVRKKGIPDEYIKIVERLPDEEEEEEEVWKRPRSPTELLEEILDEYGVKEKAKRIILRKSERMGGLHPNTVYNLLRDLDTGLPDKAIHYLTDDYYWALQQEQRKAQQMGVRVVYPLGPIEEPVVEPRYEGAYGYPRRETYPYYPPSYEPRYPVGPRYEYPQPPARTHRPSYGYPQAQALTAEDVRRIIREERMRELEKTKYDELMEKIAKLAEEVKALKERPPTPIVPPNVVTKEELEKREKDAYIKTLEKTVESMKETVAKYEQMIDKIQDRYERMLEKEREKRKEDREKLIELMKDYQKQIEKMREKMDELRTKATIGFSDEKTALTWKAMDMIDKRLESLGRKVDIFLRQATAPQAPPKREESAESSKVQLPPELLWEEEEEE